MQENRNFILGEPLRQWVVRISIQSSQVNPKWHMFELEPKNGGRNLEIILDYRKSRK